MRDGPTVERITPIGPLAGDNPHDERTSDVMGNGQRLPTDAFAREDDDRRFVHVASGWNPT